MTERTYAVRALKALERQGWCIFGTSESGAIVGGRTATRAVEDVMAVEMGAIVVIHPTHGRATLHLLFQNGEPEEVIYDVSAKTTEVLDLIDRTIATTQEG